ncbi:hypothetical protein CONLIGDRAFT_444145 [Coniochaeta ligniaria NRRL 30616]|uniref:Uncharacterized protein n=1 Tax=Coniochaeta ligniaria NRRL 30616 TaxID=1408157 RepID=A0A1J7JJ58_9PEZI|nr:hypothetical protein CONLIGDRAFT_444145 [Coniochaeta ligniaria NRRL 30616]
MSLAGQVFVNRQVLPEWCLDDLRRLDIRNKSLSASALPQRQTLKSSGRRSDCRRYGCLLSIPHTISFSSVFTTSSPHFKPETFPRFADHDPAVGGTDTRSCRHRLKDLSFLRKREPKSPVRQFTWNSNRVKALEQVYLILSYLALACRHLVCSVPWCHDDNAVYIHLLSFLINYVFWVAF